MIVARQSAFLQIGASRDFSDEVAKKGRLLNLWKLLVLSALWLPLMTRVVAPSHHAM